MKITEIADKIREIKTWNDTKLLLWYFYNAQTAAYYYAPEWKITCGDYSETKTVTEYFSPDYSSAEDTTSNRRKEMNNFISKLKSQQVSIYADNNISPILTTGKPNYYFAHFDIPSPGTYTVYIDGTNKGTIEITESGKWYEFPTI